MEEDLELAARCRQLRITLKSGEYDGGDIMRAWCALAQAADVIERQAAAYEAGKAAGIEAAAATLDQWACNRLSEETNASLRATASDLRANAAVIMRA